MSYTGDDWIFFENAYLSYDGNTREVSFNKYNDKESDNSGGKVWEWIGKIGDIDIITQTEDGKITIALCNWEKEKIMFEDYEWFLFCADKAKISADYICLFSARGFDEKIILEAEERGIIKLYTAETL